MIETIFQSILDALFQLGYPGIIALMAIESSFIPFPSEIVIPPAAFLAAQGKMNLYLVFISGLLGSLIGALINYYLALHLGRKIIFSLSKTKWAKRLMITEEALLKSEDYFNRYGNIATFFGRLIFGVRQLISLPAGFSRMPMLPFLLYTTLGSSVWIAILAAIGYYFGSSPELMNTIYSKSNIIVSSLGVLFIVLLLYYYYRRYPARVDQTHDQ